MPYRNLRFGSAYLPDRMPEDDLDTGDAEGTLVDSVGGAFDHWGDRRRLPRKDVIQHRGKYVGEKTYWVDHLGNYIVDHLGNRIIIGTAEQMLRSQVDAIKAKEGQRDSLWRQREDDGALQWKTARLLRVNHTQTVNEAKIIAECFLAFETLMAGWRDEAAAITSRSVSDGVLDFLNVHNDGVYTVEDAVLTVARTSGTITAVRVTGSGIDLSWSGSIEAGETLTIDAGQQTVQIGDGDEYSGFALNAGHTADTWLPLSAGQNILHVTVTGGNADVSVEHYAQWP